jgi:hypothetical protein
MEQLPRGHGGPQRKTLKLNPVYLCALSGSKELLSHFNLFFIVVKSPL